MTLTGIVRQRDKVYNVIYKPLKYSDIWTMVNPYHSDDIDAYYKGEPVSHRLLDEYNISKVISKEYIRGSLNISRVKGTFHGYGNTDDLTGMLSEIDSFRSYGFNKNSILEDTVERVSTISTGISGERSFELKRTFHAVQGNIVVRYTMVGRGYTSLNIESPDFSIRLQSNYCRHPKLDYEEIDNHIEQRRLKGITLPMIDYAMLKAAMGGMSWYEDEKGEILKDYKTIETIQEFEWDVMRPMVEEYERCIKEDEEFILAMDTETSGLRVYSLPDTSPLKDKLTTIQLTWTEDQGVLVFLDMEYMQNVPKTYVMKRLAPFFEIALEGKTEFEVDVPYSVGEEGSFQTRTVRIDRTKINLTGHNTLFDGMVCYDEGVHVYFNNDTMQMAFNMNPELSRGKKGLKTLTRILFKVNTPELEDLLGKGNEDKFRYLRDKLVAKIYGCADTDFSRKVYTALLKFMPPQMLDSYRKQDMPLIYGLIPAQYNGMRMNMDEVQADGMLCKQNMEQLEELIYSYVGSNIDINNQIDDLTALYDAGMINKETLTFKLTRIHPNPEARYLYKISGKEAVDVVYGKLHYPIVKRSEKTNAPSLDSQAMKRLLMYEKTEEEQRNALIRMEEDLPNLLDPDEPLIEAKKFNKYKYPLAYLLSTYATWRKEYTSYYAPLLKDGMNGRLYKNFSLTRIETRRIANPGQTMKGSLKRLVLSHGDDYYLADWDKSQVEYRNMISLAKFTAMIELMKDPEKDFHTETASLVHGIPAHRVPKGLRKKTKPISFGIPYGLGERKMCENIFGKVTDDNLYETRKLLHRFKTANKPVIDFLEHVRDEALVPREFPPGFKTFIGLSEDAKVGYVKNDLGFWRLFPLDNLDKKAIAAIRRKAGNYPIQSFAAELFRMDLINLLLRCIKEGIQDKIVWHMLIHDELLFSVHKSIHPYYLYKILSEECMTPQEGHTNYFIGINIGDNWSECKDDRSEAPIKFVMEAAKEWDVGKYHDVEWVDDAKAVVFTGKMQYVCKRITQVLEEMYPGCSAPGEVIDLKDFQENCTNYTVRSYVNELFKPNRTEVSSKQFDEFYESCFESYMLMQFGEGKSYINTKGEIVEVYSNERIVQAAEDDDLLSVFGNFDALAEDEGDSFDFESGKGVANYWSFDGYQDAEEATFDYIKDYYDDFDATLDELTPLEYLGYDEDKLDNGVSIVNAKLKKDFLYVKKYHQKVVITLQSKAHIKEFKKIMRNHLAGEDAVGLKVIVRIGGESVVYARLLRADADLELLDSELALAFGVPNQANNELTVKKSLEHCRRNGNNLILRVDSKRDVAAIKDYLKDYVAEDGLRVCYVTPLGRENWLSVADSFDVYKLDEFIGGLR